LVELGLGSSNKQFNFWGDLQLDPVASLGWVSPGVATEGVTPIFFPEKKLATFFVITVSSSMVSPLEGVTPHLFYLSDLVYTLFFVNLPTKNFFLRVSSPGGCHPGRSAPSPHSLVTPLAGSRNLFKFSVSFQMKASFASRCTIYIYIFTC